MHYRYFFSFAFQTEDGRQGFGNCTLDLSAKFDSGDQINLIEDIISEQIPVKDCIITILGATFLKEID